MLPNRPLSMSVVLQDEAPGYSKAYLTADQTGRLSPITTAEAEAMVDFVIQVSGKKSAALVWWTDEDPRLNVLLGQAEFVSEPEEAAADATASRFYGLFSERSRLADNLRSVWNSFDNVRVFPLDSSEQLETVVTDYIDDESDNMRVGLDWDNRWYSRQGSGCLALAGRLVGTLHFAVRLMFSQAYRRELMDPFRQRKNMRLTESLGAFCWKVGDDEAVGFEVMGTTRNLREVASDIFDRYGIPLEIHSQARDTIWQGSAT